MFDANQITSSSGLESLPLPILQSVVRVQAEMVKAGLDLSSLAQKVSDAMRNVFPQSEGAAVELLEGDRLFYFSSSGFLASHAGTTIPLLATLSSLALETNETLSSEDVSADERVGRSAAAKMGIQSMMVAPLTVKERRFGVLKVASTSKNSFRESDRILLSVIASSFASAIANSREFSANKQQLEEATFSNEQSFKAMAESLPQLVWTALPSGDCNFLSRQWVEYTGMKQNVQLGRAWLDLVIHPEDRERVAFHWTGAVGGLHPYDIEYRLRRADGAYRWFKTRAMPAKNLQGAIVYWFGTCTDIHDQKLTEEALERGLQTRDDFLAIVSHELRTPLTAMKLRTQTHERALARLPDQAIPPSQFRDLLGQMNTGLDRLIRLVEDMLDISQIQGERLAFQFETCDLKSMVEEQLERLRPELARVGISLVVEAKEAQWVKLDKFRFEQVITNLTVNAIRYAPNAPLKVNLLSEGDSAVLSFCDRGRGILEKDRERIFGRFERLLPASEVSGLGLGLFIARDIVRQHGGTIQAEGNDGHGICFVIRLPKAAREAERGSVEERLLE